MTTRIILFSILFLCASGKLGAQGNYFNLTHGFDSQQSAHTSLIVNNDTLKVFGLINNSTVSGFNSRVISFVDPFSGEKYRTVIAGDTNFRYSAGGYKETAIIGNKIYSILNKNIEDTTLSIIQKYDFKGHFLFDSTYNLSNYYSTFRQINTTNDNKLLMIGDIETSFNNLDVRLVWMDTNGQILNEIIYNLPSQQYGFTIDPFINNSYIISGGAVNSNNAVPFIWNIDGSGNILWQKNLGGNGYASGNSKPCSDSSIIFYGSIANPGQLRRPRVIKFDRFGNELWTYTLPDYPGIEVFSSNAYELMVENEDGSCTFVGRIRDTIYNRPIAFIQNISKNGESNWFRKLSIRTNDNYVTDLIKAPNGDFLISGYVFPDGPGTTEDGWLMRVNCLGYFQGPTDSSQVSIQENAVQLTNHARYFDHSNIFWGDGTQDIHKAETDSVFQHAYDQTGTYTITTQTIACNDTLIQSYAVNITVPKTSSELLVYPNPGSGIFTMQLLHDQPATLSVYDASGRKIIDFTNVDLNSPYILDLTAFADGMYSCMVEVDGKEKMFKVIVQK